MEKYCRAGQATDDKIQCMHSACCITKATNTHSEYVILIAFPLQQWLYERDSFLSYMYTACIVAHKVVNTIIHGLLQLHSKTSLSLRIFHHDQWFRATKKLCCLGITYVQHITMCFVWGGQGTAFKVMTKVAIPEGSLSLYSVTPLIRINWADESSG